MSHTGPADREPRIRDLAYSMWMEEGCPDGRADEHWRKASDAIDQEDAAVIPSPDLAEPASLVMPNR